MLNPPALAQAVVAARPMATPLADVVFRSIWLRWFGNFAAANPLFSGPDLAGSRYIPPNSQTRALYAAFDPETAHREGPSRDFYDLSAGPAGQATKAAGGLRPSPVALIGVYVRAARLLDLHDPFVRLQLGISSVAELTGPWNGVPQAPTRVLGDAAFADGHFEGLLYPSVRNPGHRCVVLFPDRLLATSLVHIQGFSAVAPPPPVTLPDAQLP